MMNIRTMNLFYVFSRRFVPALFFAVLPFSAAAQSAQTYYFSPGTQSPQKMLVVPLSITDSRYIKAWHFTVTDANGKQVYQAGEALPHIAERPDNWREILTAFFKPKQSVAVPKSVTWNGIDSTGKKSPDGLYFFYFDSTDDNDNYRETPRYRVIIDTVPPTVTVTRPAAMTFGDAAKPALAITQTGSREDLWKGEIRDETGKIVRNFQWRDSTPQSFQWDGKDNAGITLPDAYYRYTINATDAAGNVSAPVELAGIHLESITPEAQAGRALAELAPNSRFAKRQTFSILANKKTDIAEWNFSVINTDTAAGASVGPAFIRQGKGDTLPAQLSWDGKFRDGSAIAEGQFKGVLTIKYTTGAAVTTETPPFLCTGLVPQLTLSTAPRLFSPDGDGENDILTLSPVAKSVLPLASWSIVIQDPNEKPFKTWTGKSEIPAKLEWNGRGDDGSLVESAMNYPWVFSASDTQEQSATIAGTISVDVLIMRDGDRYILRVPAIIFRANNADFVSKSRDSKRGLEPDVIANNERVLTRVVEILQKFNNYRVKIEGHANSETGTEKEEKEQLIPLSEKRAEFVRDWLVDHGIAAQRLSVEGVGGRRPVIKDRKDRDNWWKNRRVEFILQR